MRPIRGGLDPRRLRLADHAVAAGTLLYLTFMIIPWYSIGGFDLGAGYRFPGASVNGFDSGIVVLAFVLLLLASAWALLPAFTDVPLGFPRSVVTAGLAAFAFLCTLIEWLSDLDIGFTLMGLLTLLSSVVVLAFAVLRLLPELGARGSMPGGLARATRWANRPAPLHGRPSSGGAPAPGPEKPGERPHGG